MGVAKHGNHSDKPGKTDRKIDLLMGELRKYGVSVAGIQETKWFGKDMWPVGRCTFCTLVVLCQGIRKELVGMRVLNSIGRKGYSGMEKCRGGVGSS